MPPPRPSEHFTPPHSHHMKQLISVLVPVFNEESVLPMFHQRMGRVFDELTAYRCEFIFVDDGSTDATANILRDLALRDPRVSFLRLSRNFGKEAAMSAGLDQANGDAVAIFDADLQDPPELLLRFVDQWAAGFDVVYAQRSQRDTDTWLKRTTARAFYKVMLNLSRVNLPTDAGDCRLMSRRVVEALRRLREHHRFMKGLFAWVGFPSVAVPYRREQRAAGQSKFNYWKLWNFALEGITSFSTVPLRIASYLGFLIALGAFLEGLWTILKTFVWGEVVRGYPTLLVTILLLGGVQLFFIGVLGEYLGRIFGETKNRPLYLLQEHVRSRIEADGDET